ncbi:PQQ-binding-like beta-propeller repeat protein [Kitasatospora sp. RG8]|uniref:serine/threonine-protein kinase n=1 Tax=Kitasatospora sp. RG8 TaxID=2820815 RepID=UPI001ADFB9EB|nr:protein kinase [Kitasatospora sp. RG8]MBP0448803.1 PQQ-binding-like beta-propeller repeat protein [Kitasatospora sp. RG8]
MEQLLAHDPQSLGPYTLLGRLGEGGMGVVYLGRTPGGRALAIKTIRRDLAGVPGFLERFAREVRAARRVSGTGTVPVIDSDTGGPIPWLATAYLPSLSLDAAVAEAAVLPEASLWRLLGGLAEALAHVHESGLIHRDLKPTNVLLTLDGPRLIDFGIARAVDGTALTTAGVVIGSAGFMSPEQAEGRPVGPESDVFSLGAVIAYAATGRGPFGDGSGAELIYRVVHRHPDLRGLPPVLRQSVTAMMAKNPAERPHALDLVQQTRRHQGYSQDWLPGAIAWEIARRAADLLAFDLGDRDMQGHPATQIDEPISQPGPASSGSDTAVHTEAGPGSAERPATAGVTEAARPTRRKVLIALSWGTGMGSIYWAQRKVREANDPTPDLKHPSWAYKHKDAITSNMELDGVSVYFGDSAGFVASVGSSSGSPKLKWRTRLGEEAVSQVLRDWRSSTLIVRDKAGRIGALDDDTGELKWTTARAGEAVLAPQRLDYERVVISFGYPFPRRVEVLDLKTGETTMAKDFERKPYSLSSDGSSITLGSLSGSYRVINAKDGGEEGILRVPVGAGGLIGRVDDTCYAHTLTGVAATTDPASALPKIEWSFTADGDDVEVDHGAPLIMNGAVLFRYGAAVYAVDRRSGARRWKFRAGGLIISSIIFGDENSGLIFFASSDRKIHAVSTENGSNLWSFEGMGAIGSMAAERGVVYVTSGSSLYALDPRGPQWT